MVLRALPLLRAILTAAEMYQLEGLCKRRACDDSVDELETPDGDQAGRESIRASTISVIKDVNLS